MKGYGVMAKKPIPENTPESQVKRCAKCSIEKPFSEFHKSKDGRYGLQSYCKLCKSQYGQDNSDEIAARLKQYHQDNKVHASLKSKQYREKNKEIITKKKKAYHEANKDEINARRRKHYTLNKKEMLLANKEYRQTENGKASKRDSRHRRRALKYGSVSTKFNREEVFERDGYVCQLCGKKTRADFKSQYHPLYPNLDHIVPLSLGGSHTKENTQCLCYKCNMEKGNIGTGDQLRLFGG
jgi:5-methylcytosine-specific restriction endonuclease McrA